MKYLEVATVIGCVNARLANPESRQAVPEDFQTFVKNELIHVSDIPETWIWNNANGINYLTNVHNQHSPQHYSSCWAHAAILSLFDRINIARKASQPDINIASQSFIDCLHNPLGSHGGNAATAYQWMSINEMTDESCSIYTGQGIENNDGICSPITKCTNCTLKDKACGVPDQNFVYKTDEYGLVSGEENMIQEIYQRGPIACGIAVPMSLEEYTGGVYCDDSGDLDIVHEISVVGFGVTEDGQKYWTVRNSWGNNWGENGFFRVCRGVNNIAIEKQCAWTTPLDTWSTGVQHASTQKESNYEINDKINQNFPQLVVHPPPNLNDDFQLKNQNGSKVEDNSFSGDEQTKVAYPKAETLLSKYKMYMETVKTDNYTDHQSRFTTFQFVLDHILQKPLPVIVELGTTRSFVDGKFPGCMSTNKVYWEPNSPQKWDFGAGMFTYIIPRCLTDAFTNKSFIFHTVDCDPNAIQIAKTITADFSNIHYHLMTSDEFLNNIFDTQADLIYMDVGNVDEQANKFHLEDAKSIVSKNLLKPDGLILIDDVHHKHADSKWGKGKYSIPYLMEQGFEIICEEFQVVMKRSKI